MTPKACVFVQTPPPPPQFPSPFWTEDQNFQSSLISYRYRYLLLMRSFCFYLFLFTLISPSKSKFSLYFSFSFPFSKFLLFRFIRPVLFFPLDVVAPSSSSTHHICSIFRLRFFHSRQLSLSRKDMLRRLSPCTDRSEKIC